MGFQSCFFWKSFLTLITHKLLFLDVSIFVSFQMCCSQKWLITLITHKCPFSCMNQNMAFQRRVLGEHFVTSVTSPWFQRILNFFFRAMVWRKHTLHAKSESAGNWPMQWRNECRVWLFSSWVWKTICFVQLFLTMQILMLGKRKVILLPNEEAVFALHLAENGNRMKI